MPDFKVENGGDALLKVILAHGASVGFGVPGESYLSLLNAMAKAGDDFRFIQTRHEAGAANMAEAYGKMTGKPGLCFVTRGPGATHAAIGLHTAYQDSTPMILFVGQVASDQRDREAFQEMDYSHFFSECSKWSATIMEPERIGEYVTRAFHIACSGRPGPVVLALPEDMLSGPAPEPSFKPVTLKRGAPDTEALNTLSDMLATAKKPMIMVGGSGWTPEAVKDLETFSLATNLPVAASFRAQDRFDNRLPTYIGDIGIGANPKLIEALDECDLLISFGPRIGEMTTGSYSRLQVPVTKQKLVHIHQSGDEIAHVYHADLSIESTPPAFAKALHACAGAMKLSASVSDWTKTLRNNYVSWHDTAGETGSKGSDLNLGHVYEILNKRLPDDRILCNGAGNYTGWVHRFLDYRQFPSQLAPTSGAMGYGVPAALAAKLVAPERTVVAFAGDGCFMMSVQELATAFQHEIGVLFIVANNSQYGTIRMHQERAYPGNQSGTALINPDFVALGQSFGLRSYWVTKTEEFEPAFEKALAETQAGRPALIELQVDSETKSPGARYS